MLHHTKGIVLRSVKYGETSVIVLVFTEKFGIQSYLVNGVRVSSKKGAGRANLFQPAAILDLVVYHSELKQLQRIKEFKWQHLYEHILSDVKKNSVALYMVELLTKCLKQPEDNPELFHFSEDCFLHLDKANDAVTANFPLFFALQLTHFFGASPTPLKGLPVDAGDLFFDLKAGDFSNQRPQHPHFIEGKQAEVAALVLQSRLPEELEDLKLHGEFRRQLLHACEVYYSFHIPDFGTMKTLAVLKEILS